ncbi:MAG: DUF2911 domain-containing protein [Bacteroidota bacterium]
MNRVLIFIAGLVIIGLAGATGAYIYTKSHSPEASDKLSTDAMRLSVAYSSPSIKGRKIFGEEGEALVPYGKVWRTGANEATMISFGQDVKIGGKVVPKGEYSLFTIPTSTDWTVILNKERGQWGTSYNQAQDQIRTKALASDTSESQESLSLTFSEESYGADLHIRWATKHIRLPIMK